VDAQENTPATKKSKVHIGSARHGKKRSKTIKMIAGDCTEKLLAVTLVRALNIFTARQRSIQMR
jgi:hypothetical protein